MKIIIPGGSGQIGTLLARAFHQDGHEVVVLSRNRFVAPWRVVIWNGQSLGDWMRELEGADAVIHLTGRSVNCRYTQKNRQEVLKSRTISTQLLGRALAQAKNPPRVWLQASTATIYAHRYDAPNDETTGQIGGSELNVPDTWRFSIDVAQSWERAALEALPLPKTRLILLRSAMTMSPDKGGVFDVILSLVRLGLGGRAGNGQQYVSWIHEIDFIRAIYWLIEHESVHGAVNLTSPHPLTNSEFMCEIRQAWGTTFGLPATKWMLEIGALFLRTETELILKSRRVVPTLLLQKGFVFQFPNWREAAQDLCARWRKNNM